MKRMLRVILVLSIFPLACNPSTSTPLTAPTSTSMPPTARPPVSQTPRSINLSHRPLYWFAPLPPQTSPYDGSDDFMDLFASDAPWEQAANYIQVFKLYGGWVAADSTEAELRQAIQAIRQRGLALAVEVGPLNPTAECGWPVEGFAGDQGVDTINLIQAAGGHLNLIAFDEPYYYGHFYGGENACRWTAEKIAREIHTFIQRVRAVFPDVIIGDIEPLADPAYAADYNDWLDTFRAVNGYDLAFLHLDIAWSDTRWPQEVKAIEEHGRQIGVPIGLIYNGNSQDQTDEAWIANAGERVKRYELEARGTIDHVIFQSWHDRPDRALPESEPNTISGFIKTYFENKPALGFQLQNTSNVALKKTVRVSASIEGYGGESAVDGDPGTWWSSGADAPQWIEIDLGEAYNIREIRLLTGQHPPGMTEHQVLGKGLDTGDNFVALHSFEGETEDSQWLSYLSPEPWTEIRFIRIESVLSPSWIAWREIEIIR
jgi:F5/8 type C domain